MNARTTHHVPFCDPFGRRRRSAVTPTAAAAAATTTQPAHSRAIISTIMMGNHHCATVVIRHDKRRSARDVRESWLWLVVVVVVGAFAPRTTDAIDNNNYHQAHTASCNAFAPALKCCSSMYPHAHTRIQQQMFIHLNTHTDYHSLYIHKCTHTHTHICVYNFVHKYSASV